MSAGVGAANFNFLPYQSGTSTPQGSGQQSQAQVLLQLQAALNTLLQQYFQQNTGGQTGLPSLGGSGQPSGDSFCCNQGWQTPPNNCQPPSSPGCPTVPPSCPPPNGGGETPPSEPPADDPPPDETQPKPPKDPAPKPHTKQQFANFQQADAYSNMILSQLQEAFDDNIYKSDADDLQKGASVLNQTDLQNKRWGQLSDTDRESLEKVGMNHYIYDEFKDEPAKRKLWAKTLQYVANNIDGKLGKAHDNWFMTTDYISKEDFEHLINRKEEGDNQRAIMGDNTLVGLVPNY